MNTHPDISQPSDSPLQLLHLADLASESVAADLATRLPALELQADQLEKRARALRQIIAGVRALTGRSVETERQTFESHRTSFEVGPPDPHGPRGPDAVLHVMYEQPVRLWKVIDLKRELLRRGWAPTPKAVEASVKRLRGAGKVELVSYGHYRLIEVEFGEVSADGPRAA
ncbi:MAG: hypothetical protein ACJ757_17445 [Gaiellaceae bacterium]